jgi:hypothetical protein
MTKTEVRFVPMPSGYGTLPYSGGLLDQPAFLVDCFTQYLAAERNVAMKQLTK